MWKSRCTRSKTFYFLGWRWIFPNFCKPKHQPITVQTRPDQTRHVRLPQHQQQRPTSSLSVALVTNRLTNESQIKLCEVSQGDCKMHPGPTVVHFQLFHEEVKAFLLLCRKVWTKKTSFSGKARLGQDWSHWSPFFPLFEVSCQNLNS